MRSITALLTVVLTIACGAPDQPVVDDDTTPVAEDANTPAAPTLADFAGTWESVAVLEGVEEPVPNTMTGSAAGNDWTLTLEDRPAIPLQVSVVGDSLIAVSEEYESILRPGVMVRVRTASVLQDGALVGNLLSTYQTPEGEERVTGTLRGTRIQ